MSEPRMIKIKCTECDNEFDYDIAGLEVGDIIECPICGVNLEVISLEPFKVEAVFVNK